MPTPPEIPEPESEFDMPLEAQVFAGLLAVAGLLVGAGAWLLHPAAGLMSGGLLLGVWSWLVLHEDEQ